MDEMDRRDGGEMFQLQCLRLGSRHYQYRTRHLHLGVADSHLGQAPDGKAKKDQLVHHVQLGHLVRFQSIHCALSHGQFTDVSYEL